MSSIRRTLERGVLRDGVLVDIGLTCLAVMFIGLSYGAVAVASGFPLWVPAAQSVLVLAGASEFRFIGIVVPVEPHCGGAGRDAGERPPPAVWPGAPTS